jgi:hypothetical protein
VCAAVAILALTGCGSSKSGPVTQAEYVAKANAVCRHLGRDIAAVGRESSTSFQQKLSELLKPRERADAELRAIPKFPGDKFTAEWLGFRTKALAALKDVAKKGLTSPASRAANNVYYTEIVRSAAIARNYGLVDCAGLAAS